MLLQLTIWLLIVVAGAPGCDALLYGFGQPHPRSPRYAVGFANQTDGELHEVHAEWTSKGVDYAASAGILVPGAVKIDNDAPDPIPAFATVVWQTADGREHHQTLPVASKVPNISHWSGAVFFRIAPDGVTVVPLAGDHIWDLVGKN
jgi:hypothetical protein